jgi:hypothetical protein
MAEAGTSGPSNFHHPRVYSSLGVPIPIVRSLPTHNTITQYGLWPTGIFNIINRITTAVNTYTTIEREKEMKSYTRLIMITLTTAWTTWYQASSYACAVSAFLFRSISFMAILTYILGKETRVFLQPFVDSFVESCMESPDSMPPTLPTPAPTPILPLVCEPAGAYPVQANIPDPIPSIADFTSAQLKAIAREHKLPRYSRRTKTELFDTLLLLDLI